MNNDERFEEVESVDVCFYQDPKWHYPESEEEYDSLRSEILKHEFHAEIPAVAYNIGQFFHHMSCATYYNGIGTIDNFKSIQLFALDFNNDQAEIEGTKPLLVEQILAKTRMLGLNICVIYEKRGSRTNNNIPKYCVVFAHYKPITDINTAILVQRMLLKLFPEADQSCIDPCRIIFGSTGLCCYDPTGMFGAEWLAYLMKQHLIYSDFDAFPGAVEGLMDNLDMDFTKKQMLDVYASQKIKFFEEVTDENAKSSVRKNKVKCNKKK